MLRPMTVAPMPEKPAATAASSTPVVPPDSPIISAPGAGLEHPVVQPGTTDTEGVLEALVGPATYPSSDMAMAWTRSFGIRRKPSGRC